MDQIQMPHEMDKQLDVLHCHTDGGLLVGASCLTGRYWLGSLWFYQTPEWAPDVERCTAGVQLEAGLSDAQWVDSSHVLVGLDTGGVALWNLEDDYHTFVLSHAAAGHDDIVTSVSVVADRTQAASSGQDRCIKLWDLSTVSLLTTSQAHCDLVSNIDCHPSDSHLLVSCGQDNRILLWDKRKSKPASILNKSPLQHTPTCVRWQPGQTHKLAVGSESGQIVILDTRVGVDNDLSLSPHSGLVYNLQFSTSKPSLLASAGEDCKTVVTSIDDDSLKEIYSDTTHTDFVRGITWSSDSQLFSCGWDTKVLSHDIRRGCSTIMGQVHTVATAQVNGDSHGDDVDMKTEQSPQCKSSYSQAVKAAQENAAEG